MPITYRIDAELGIARVTARGVSSPDEVRAYRRDLLADPMFGPGLHVLVDATDLDTSAFSRAFQDESGALVWLRETAVP